MFVLLFPLWNDFVSELNAVSNENRTNEIHAWVIFSQFYIFLWYYLLIRLQLQLLLYMHHALALPQSYPKPYSTLPHPWSEIAQGNGKGYIWIESFWIDFKRFWIIIEFRVSDVFCDFLFFIPFHPFFLMLFQLICLWVFLFRLPTVGTMYICLTFAWAAAERKHSPGILPVSSDRILKRFEMIANRGYSIVTRN